MKKGKLLKKGQAATQWKERTFCLTKQRWLYYSVDGGYNMVGAFDISQVTKINKGTSKKHNYVIDLCFRDGIRRICADSDKERDEWIEALQAVPKPKPVQQPTLDVNMQGLSMNVDMNVGMPQVHVDMNTHGHHHHGANVNMHGAGANVNMNMNVGVPNVQVQVHGDPGYQHQYNQTVHHQTHHHDHYDAGGDVKIKVKGGGHHSHKSDIKVKVKSDGKLKTKGEIGGVKVKGGKMKTEVAGVKMKMKIDDF